MTTKKPATKLTNIANAARMTEHRKAGPEPGDLERKAAMVEKAAQDAMAAQSKQQEQKQRVGVHLTHILRTTEQQRNEAMSGMAMAQATATSFEHALNDAHEQINQLNQSIAALQARIAELEEKLEESVGTA